MESTQPEPTQPPQPPSEPQTSPPSGGVSGVRWVLVRAVALGLIIVIALIGLVWLVSLPLLSGGHVPSVGSTPQQTVQPTVTGTSPTATAPVLVTGSIEQMPRNIEVYVTIEPKNPATAQVTARFDGGPGKGSVKEIEVRLTRSDGTVVSGTMGTQTFSPEVILQGTKGTDRVEVIVKLYSGKTYKIIDKMVPSRIRL